MKKKIIKEFSTIKEMMKLALEDAGDKIAYKYKTPDKEIISVTFRKFYSDVEALGAFLTSLGFGEAHIACVGENSYRWIVTYLTALKSAGVFVPLDRELPADNLIGLINDSDASVLFVDAKHKAMLSDRLAELPNIKALIYLDSDSDNNNDNGTDNSNNNSVNMLPETYSFDAIVEKGRKMRKGDFDALTKDTNELKMLVYTSGTTGIAKGVMLTEHNLVSAVYNGLQLSQLPDVGLSVLPYHHTYEAVCGILVGIHYHTTLCINESYRMVSHNLKLYRPQYMYIVPMFADFFRSAVLGEIEKQGKMKTFERAVKISESLRRRGIDLRRVIFKQIHRRFGGRLVKVVCGGAPINADTAKFFDTIGMAFHIGYGITECSPLVSVNTDKDIKFNSAGHRLPCIEWKIDNPVEDGIGEICVKGDIVMKGYYKRDDLTDEVLVDGWFHTGDYGYITDNDEIVITGRKKNIIVLNNGKNIYPEEIEGYISSAVRYINEVVVRAKRDTDGNETGLAAEIYCEEPHDKKQILTDIGKALENLPMYKRVSDVIVREEPFPKTTTNKIKR